MGTKAPEGLDQVLSFYSKIGSIALLQDKTKPVTQEVMQAISSLSMTLLRSKGTNIKHYARRINETLLNLAKISVEVSNAPMGDPYIAPYFSVTNTASFIQSITLLANAVNGDSGNSKDKELVISNICKWGKENVLLIGELWKYSHNKNNQFSFDLIQWVETLSAIYLMLSTIDSCPQRIQKELRENALRLVEVFYSIEYTKETVSRLATFSFTENLYKITKIGITYECEEFTQAILKVFLKWGILGDGVAGGWALLEQTLLAITCIHVGGKATEEQKLLAEIQELLNLSGAPSLTRKLRAVQGIRNTLRQPERHSLNPIESSFAALDRDEASEFINKIDEILSADTAGNT